LGEIKSLDKSTKRPHIGDFIFPMALRYDSQMAKNVVLCRPSTGFCGIPQKNVKSFMYLNV